MSNGADLISYFNSLFEGLKKEFYSQRGEGTRFRTLLIGVDHFAKKLESIEEEDEDKFFTKLSEKIKKIGIVGNVNITIGPLQTFEYFPIKGSLINANVKNCIHYSVDKKLVDEKVPPVVFCPIANIIMYFAMTRFEGPKVESELVSVDISERGCTIEIAVISENGGEG
jgi:hypothetical protein